MQSCLKTYAILSLLLQVTIFFLIFVAKSIIQLSEVDMIKTKTIKTPLMMTVAFWPTSCSSGLVPKSTLLHNPEVQYGFVPKHSLHGGKNPALRAEKLIFAMRTFFVKRSGTVFLPRTMSYVAEQCVVMSWFVRELAHRHKAMKSTQKLEEPRHWLRGF